MPGQIAGVNWKQLWPVMLASLKSLLETHMSTRNILESYFKALQTKQDWASLLTEDVVFTSFTAPNKQITGKSAYVEGTKRFYSMIQSLEVRGLIVEGSRACALTRYQLRGPQGAFESDVAEIYSVRGTKIDTLGIYFDSAPFPK